MRLVSVIMLMSMTMTVIACGRRISAAFGIEWRFDLGHIGCEIKQQRLHRRIASQPKTIAKNLHRHVAVPQCPSNARECGKISRAHLQQRLGLRDDFDQAAILEDQRVVGTQPDRRFEIELDEHPTPGKHVSAVGPSPFEIEKKRIRDRFITTLAGCQYFDRTRHRSIPPETQPFQLSRVGRS
jgi:hypothetical protein